MFACNLEVSFSGCSLDSHLTIQREVGQEKELPFKWPSIANFTLGISGASSSEFSETLLKVSMYTARKSWWDGPPFSPSLALH